MKKAFRDDGRPLPVYLRFQISDLRSQQFFSGVHFFTCQVRVFSNGLYVTLNTMFVTVLVGLVPEPEVPPLEVPAGELLLLDELELVRARLPIT